MRLFIIFIVFLLSCGKENSRIDFTRDEKKLIDSLAQKEIKIIAKEIDSLCKQNFDKRVHALVDSIMAKRLEEQKRLLK